jgi:hypothetical protein
VRRIRLGREPARWLRHLAERDPDSADEVRSILVAAASRSVRELGSAADVSMEGDLFYLRLGTIRMVLAEDDEELRLLDCWEHV